MTCNGDCNQGRECNCKCKMTKDEQGRPMTYWGGKKALAETQEPVLYIDGDCCTEGCIKCDARKVLAETQEPVAWMNDIAFSMDKELLGTRSRIVPLYTTPPSREWVGLSKSEIDGIIASAIGETRDWVRAIEAKLREKNNGT